MRALLATTITALLGVTATTPALAHTPTDMRAPAASFSTPMFGDRSEALWPLELGVEIVALTDAGTEAKVVVPLREVVVADGQHLSFTEVVDTPRGQRSFGVELVARHHAGSKIELEYDLVVRQARFAELTWSDYVLHRLALGPRPSLGPEVLAAARADIVETEGQAHGQRFSVDGDLYEIRIHAASMRG
ncbi:hypothetical protein G6O69_08060 [Pseudenhygromyxa sp. WMMC2535]|uniref:hypothetical protein n=1 Tax=Pseudenhygromyxa sp. WMMC2535 TaxID=2712867 RepID=UPI0015533D8F|nr:hypothetical protein [Pseudenhygromyxa sp. WMMC2535]NVB37784.1 hypothetical protein [Pseudenhygromyxa sp. WMMC2535]